jgi:hypothetical protein
MSVTSLLTEHLEPPASERSRRALRVAGDRAGDVLAERTLWLAIATPRAREPAERLRDRLQGAPPGGSATLLQLVGGALRELAEKLEGMDAAVAPALGEEDGDAYRRAAGNGEELLGGHVAPDDVVVVHDALSAVAIDAIRARGAHVVWRVCVTGAPAPAGRRAPDFIRRLRPSIDAYLLSWRQGAPSSGPLESVAAVMPAAGVLTATEFAARLGEGPRRLAWMMALAEIARGDRGECVGGYLHPRPLVAPR